MTLAFASIWSCVRGIPTDATIEFRIALSHLKYRKHNMWITDILPKTVLLLEQSTVIFMVPNLAIIFEINNNKPLIPRRTEIKVSHINLL